MNEIIEIAHKSKSVTTYFLFSGEGDNSGQFTAKGNGEIYAINSDNVDSYTIAGETVTLPFTIEDGVSYTVSITKTTEGETAQLAVIYRRAEDEEENIIVPDYNAGTGSYLYVLGENRLFKFDSNNLISSNYEGSGVFTTTPYSEITLPSLSDDGDNTNYYTAMEWVVVGGENLLLLMAFSKNVNFVGWGCYVKDDGTVWDLDFTTQDSLTTMTTGIYASQSNSSDVKNSLYDYINNYVIFCNAGGNWHTWDLENNARITDYGLVYAWRNMYQFQTMFNPNNSRFVGFTDLDGDANALFAYKMDSDYIYNAAYNKSDGYTYAAQWASDPRYYNSEGSQIGSLSKRDLGVLYNCKGLKYSNSVQKILATSSHVNNSYVFFELDDEDTTDLPAQTLQSSNIATSQTYIEMPTHIPVNDIWVCKGANGDGLYRLYFFDSTVEPSDYAYIDLPISILSLKVDRYDI